MHEIAVEAGATYGDGFLVDTPRLLHVCDLVNTFGVSRRFS